MEQHVGAVIVLAAGGGTRMKSKRCKVLHEICGHSMLSYAVHAASEVEPEQLVVVVGHQREQVLEHLADIAPHVATAVQDEQRGTGHAVLCGLQNLPDVAGEVIVTYGDVPMLTGATLRELVAQHRAAEAAVTVLTATVANPEGYGRIIRDEAGAVAGIVEHKDADATQLAIHEINSGIYVFDAAVLREGLGRIDANNAQGELYLTDVLAIARQDGRRVQAVETFDLWQTEGVNDRVQLAAITKEMNRRIVEGWMREGVTVIDPATTWIQHTVDIAPDVTILPNTMLEGATSIATGARIGPDTLLRDCEVGEDAVIQRTHAILSTIGPNATIGPYVSMRPGTELADGAHLGTFVETKNTIVGPGAKIPHLTYAGDGIVDEGANIGAGTIFANYDGSNKSRSHVGRYSFVGSNSVIVAPVDIADGAFVAAGSTVTLDVAPGALAVARGKQHNSPGWVEKTRSGSKTANAAVEADEGIHPLVQESRDKIAAKQANKEN